MEKLRLGQVDGPRLGLVENRNMTLTEGCRRRKTMTLTEAVVTELTVLLL